jgi:hypothetical protein
MIDQRIMALPVVNSVTGRPQAVVSMMNIMDYFLQIFQPDDFKDDFWHRIQRLFSNKVDDMKAQNVFRLAGTANCKFFVLNDK